jgi:hypothetical protein
MADKFTPELFKPAPEPTTELGRYRILSSTAGIRVSPLQLGAMSIGDAWSGIWAPWTRTLLSSFLMPTLKLVAISLILPITIKTINLKAG